MIIPVRCFTCGRVIASDFEKCKEKVAKGEKPQKAMDALGVERWCCRRMILTNVDLLKESASYD